LIRDEMIAAMSVDLTGQSRFAELRTALGEVRIPGLADRLESLNRAAVGSLNSQRSIISSVREEMTKALASLAEARGLAGRHADIAEAESIIDRLAPSAREFGAGLGEFVRRDLAVRRQRLARANDVINRFRELVKKRTAAKERTSPSAISIL